MRMIVLDVCAGVIVAKVSKNLSLDPNAVRRGERYSEIHDTSLSRLVGDFLSRLPLDEPEAELTPRVRRLLGAGAGKTGRGDYRAHLSRKYTRKTR